MSSQMTRAMMLGLTVGSVIVYAHIPFIGRFAHIFGRMRVFARHPSCGPMQLDANPHRQFLIRQVSSILEHHCRPVVAATE